MSRNKLPTWKELYILEREPMSEKWILCHDRLPDAGEDVILYFEDTFHNNPEGSKFDVKPAWRCNLGEKDTPDGEWAIEGRFGNYTVDLQDGIAWMPLPAPPQIN